MFGNGSSGGDDGDGCHGVACGSVGVNAEFSGSDGCGAGANASGGRRNIYGGESAGNNTGGNYGDGDSGGDSGEDRGGDSKGAVMVVVEV